VLPGRSAGDEVTAARRPAGTDVVYGSVMRRTRLMLLLSLFSCGGGGGGEGGVLDPQPDAGVGDAAALDRKHVFVTSGTFDGTFWYTSPSFPDTSGPAQADSLCASAAAGAGMAGDWRAWLSTRGRLGDPYSVDAADAADRLLDVGPWYLAGTDTVVFHNVDTMRNTPLVPIDRNEHGAEMPPASVWTGTLVGGTVGFDDCDQWWPDADTAGVVGDLSSSTSTWTDTEAGAGTGVGFRCSERAHLYCIQQ
jgi:hypothetical protein